MTVRYCARMGKAFGISSRTNCSIAACYQAAMEQLVRLDIPKALPILAQYLTVMSDLIVHPDARYLDCEEAYKQCLWLENRGYKVLKEHQVPGRAHPAAGVNKH